MIQALQSGISGMNAFMSALNIIGNNISNVSTTAYKSQSTNFQEALSQTIKSASAPTDTTGGTNASQVGLGVTLGSISSDMTQGSLDSTGRTTDLAIDGNGYFILGDSSTVAYTRDGSCSLDSNYNLVGSSSGLYVLGWQADSAGNIDTSAPITGASVIEIPVGGMSIAQQTSDVDLTGNLNASTDAGSDYDVTFEIYDSLGETHQITVTFTKLAEDSTATPPIEASTWQYEVYCDDAGASAITTGNITFDENGQSNLDSVDVSLTLTEDNGSLSPLNFTLDTSDITQLNSSNSTVSMNNQDGKELGTLESYTIDSSGLIVGTFTNGLTKNLARIAVAGFNNPEGLEKLGNNLYKAGSNSGSAVIGTAGSSGLGSIKSGYLEASNVDLAAEFSNMIVAQRGFQANSKVITTADDVLEQLVSLIR
ncbi:flagellar hook protein FlgE [bacterium]|nr:flagellar hook protein FlgE [bacterium]